MLINLASGPNVPKCPAVECKSGRGAGGFQGGLRLVSASSGYARFCVSRPVSTGHTAQAVMFYIKLKGNPCDVNGVVSQGLVSCLIHVSHLSDSGPTAHIIKVQRRVEAQWSGGAWGPPPALARLWPLPPSSEGGQGGSDSLAFLPPGSVPKTTKEDEGPLRPAPHPAGHVDLGISPPHSQDALAPPALGHLWECSE